MTTHKYIDKICCVAVILALLITGIFLNAEVLGIQAAEREMGYEDRLFDETKVHTIDILMDDWETFLTTCQSEEYSVCNVVIDGEAYKNIGIRGKGNTSLSTVSSMDSDRYSFKIEFDQYDSTGNYYGLDKLCLNNVIQDNTYMKDFLVYQMMNEFGVDAPLCSFVYITVNGEDWGLYLAVEGVEESFLQRNNGVNYGELYKPDSMSMGGGRGNGRDFSFGGMGGGFGMGSSDVKLQYIDDDPDSYSNIFSSAKTDVSEADEARLIASLKALAEGTDIESVVDIDAVLRYFVVHNFVVNGDSYTGSMIHNYYLYEEEGLLSMIPWDYNLAYGTFQGSDATGSVNDPIDSPVSGDMSDRPMISWIFENEEYTQMYHEYFAEFLSQVFESGWFTELVDNTVAMIAPYVEKDPTKFCTYEEFETGVETIREFCLLRAESVAGQLEGIIPSTEEAQNMQSGALIDASAITLSDMGTMGGGFGGGGFNFGSSPGERTEDEGAGNGDDGFGNFGDFGDFGDAGNFGDFGGFPGQGGEMPEGMELPEENNSSPSRENMPQMPEGMGNIPMNSSGSSGSMTQWILLGVSIVVLLIGLVIAYKFKR